MPLWKNANKIAILKYAGAPGKYRCPFPEPQRGDMFVEEMRGSGKVVNLSMLRLYIFIS
jgi:hypothetical protein